jgi:DNA polymerase-4
MDKIRKIIHIDMDAFYASVEQRDNPALRGKPVIVGGSPETRGVVSTASYEARKFGVHSAMPTKTAIQLCPQGILVYPHFDRYKEASEHIRAIFHDYTDLVEPMSLDEAYLDVTVNKKGIDSATRIAKEIKARIRMVTRLSASAGVSYNKFLAKVASDFQKPNGLTVIPPDKAIEFIDKLPIGKFYGVGPATEKRMAEHGIFNGADLRRFTLEEMTEYFRKSGAYFYYIARGIDEREVDPVWIRKSISQEYTYPKDIYKREQIEAYFRESAHELSLSMEKKKISGKTVTIKVRYANFDTVTRSHTLAQHTRDEGIIYSEAILLLRKTEVDKKRVRLLGLGMSSLTEDEDKIDE